MDVGPVSKRDKANDPQSIRVLELRRHTMRHKPGVHLNQAGVDLARRVGETMGKFDRVLASPLERAYETAIAMGYGVDGIDDRLLMDDLYPKALEHLNWEIGFAGWGQKVLGNKVVARFAHAQAAFWREIAQNLPDGGVALLITHGGIIEGGAVASFPDADHAAWGEMIDYCEGARLTYDAKIGKFSHIEILRTIVVG
jgi:broad specificity phosphatase PhoE